MSHETCSCVESPVMHQGTENNQTPWLMFEYHNMNSSLMKSTIVTIMNTEHCAKQTITGSFQIQVLVRRYRYQKIETDTET